MATPKHKKGALRASPPQSSSSAGIAPYEPKGWQCVLLLTGLVLVFFRDIILGNAYLWEDFLYHDYPSRNFAAVSMANGEIPLWNPYTFNGMPFLADIQKTVFYLPCTALSLFVKGGTLSFYWLELMIILHYILAGVAMFYLARSFGLRRVPALFAGATYMLSGFMITHAIHQYIVTLVAWFPLVLLLFRKALTGSWKWVFLAALVLGHSTLAGFPQLTLYFYFFLFTFFLFELLTTYKGKEILSRPALIAASKAATMVALSVAVAMIQLLPTLEFADLTFRAQITYQKATEGQFSWQQLITFLYPKFFGTAGAGGYNYHGPGTYWYYWETCMYVGILPLMLMVASTMHLKKNKYGAFFWGFGIFAILFALGDNLVVHKFFFDFVPRFNTFRNPARMGVFLTLGAALLSAFSLQHILHEQRTSNESRRLRITTLSAIVIGILIYVLLISGSLSGSFEFLKDNSTFSMIKKEALPALLMTVLSGLLVIGALRSAVLSRWLGLAALVVLLIDMSIFGGEQNNSKTNPRDYFNRSRAVVDFIKQDSNGELVRVNMRSQQGMLMDRNQGLLDRIMLMEGYTPLVLQRYLPPSRDWSQTCDMMNAKYRVATDEQRQSLTLTRATTYLPRAYMVYDARMLTDSASIFTFMQGKDFEPSRTVVIEVEPVLKVSDTSYTTQWSAKFTLYNLNSMSLNVSTPKDGFLVFSEIYYPGWIAYIDGRSQAIYRANWNQRVIPLQAGVHKVDMRFESATFTHGMWITLATLALCIAGIFYPSLTRKNTIEQQSV
jgi:hypothetical protein